MHSTPQCFEHVERLYEVTIKDKINIYEYTSVDSVKKNVQCPSIKKLTENGLTMYCILES